MREVERKYIARVDSVLRLARQASEVIEVEQSYIVAAKSWEWRLRKVRFVKPSEKAKQPTTAFKFGNGFIRREFEFDIPEWLYWLLEPLGRKRALTKVRFGVDGWEVDVFTGRHFPMVLAEIENPLLECEVTLPAPPANVTLLCDVTDSGIYANKVLAQYQGEQYDPGVCLPDAWE